jgi:hypothetical protein
VKTSRSASWAATTAVACVACVSACHGGEQAAPAGAEADAGTLAAVASTSVTGATPKDHLGPGELVEGSAAPFGVRLPRGFVVQSSFTDQAIASGPAKAVDVANYLRSRLNARATTVGAASTIFEQVQTAAVPGHELMIRVEPRPDGAGTLVTVRDVTPPPTEPNIPEAERWKKAGLTPDGKILDPTHLH